MSEALYRWDDLVCTLVGISIVYSSTESWHAERLILMAKTCDNTALVDNHLPSVMFFPNLVLKQGQCGICFETFPATSMHAAACGHRYCKDCWTGYVHTAVESGPKCLDLRCPDPECSVLVGLGSLRASLCHCLS